MQVIIYQNGNNAVAVIYPAPEALAQYGIQAIAEKDVPEGKPFKIIDIADLPARNTRALWEVNAADLTDGVGAPGQSF